MVATTGWRRDVRIALGGIDRDAQRASEAESVLESSVMDDSVLARAAAIAASQAKTSLVGGGQDRYRRRVLAALTMRALASLEHTR